MWQFELMLTDVSKSVCSFGALSVEQHICLCDMRRTLLLLFLVAIMSLTISFGSVQCCCLVFDVGH